MSSLSNDYLAGRKRGWEEVIKELTVRQASAFKKHEAYQDKFPEANGKDKWREMAFALDEIITELGAKAAILTQPTLVLPEPSEPTQCSIVDRIISAAILTTVALRLKDENALVDCLRRLSAVVNDYEWVQNVEGGE